MTAFLCIFLVPLIAIVIRHKKFQIGHQNPCEWILEYGILALLIHFFANLIVVYVFKNSGPVAANLDKYGDFAVHYLMLSMGISVSLPYLELLFEKRGPVRFSFRKSEPGRRWPIWALALLAVSMATLNLIRINDGTFWGDESFSILLARMSIPEMIQTTARDVHPPLYYLILQGFRKLLGDHPYVFHLTSVLPVLLTYAFASTKLRRALGCGAAGIFILLSTLTPSPLTYNVEVRMYSWAFLFVTLNFWYGYEILSKPTGSAWFLFSLNGLLAAYTHYYALVSVGLVSLGVFAILIARSRKNLKPCLISFIAMVVGYLPWISTFLTAVVRSIQYWWCTIIPSIRDCVNFVFGTTGADHWMMWIVLVPIALFMLATLFHLSVKRRDGALAIDTEWLPIKALLPDSTFTWVAIGIFAVAGTAAAGEAISYLFRPLFQPRYVYPATGILWLMTAVSVAKLPLPHKRLIWMVLAAVILVLGFSGWSSQYRRELDADAKTKETVAYMSDHLQNSDVLVSNIDHLSWSVLRCYFPKNQVAKLKDADWTALSKNRVWLYLNGTLTEQDAAAILNSGGTIAYMREGALATYSYHLYEVTFP